jgi:CRISPR/Cas system-associated exonuclease Cas4 (RecB family)
MSTNLKIRGSESAFMWGRLVFTDYDTGCLRKILLRSRGVRGLVQEFHNERGKTYEAIYESRYDACSREVPVQVAVDDVAGVDFAGRVDLVVGAGAGAVVHELKSTESKNVLRQVIKSGIYKTENLAQLISYMAAIGTSSGKLAYAYMEKGINGVYQIKNERSFDIQIDAFGRIVVDGRPSKWTVHDQLAHQFAAAKVVATGEVFDRPANWSAAFGSPCSYCPFKVTCAKWDAGDLKTTDEFVESGKGDVGLTIS